LFHHEKKLGGNPFFEAKEWVAPDPLPKKAVKAAIGGV
jgi:hypothetical protein